MTLLLFVLGFGFGRFDEHLQGIGANADPRGVLLESDLAEDVTNPLGLAAGLAVGGDQPRETERQVSERCYRDNPGS